MAGEQRLEFSILGPLEVRAGGDLLPVGGLRQRALLALLLLNANRVVSRDRLIEELHPDPTSGSAEHALHVQVSRLRKAIANGGREPRLIARPPGYLVRVDPGELDLAEFERRTAEGRERAREGDASGALEAFTAALGLWRGRPLADLEFESFAQIEVERLEELRLSAIEEGIEARLALGRHDEVLSELEALIASHPLRERPRAQLMLAQYRAGRQAEALETYRRTQRLLDAELGLMPGTALQRLERAILEQDPSLELLAAPVSIRRRAVSSTCPFKGLAPFTIADSGDFFGRERLVSELTGMMATATFVALVGPSGCGKTSLLHAGLLPALPTPQFVIRPGVNPEELQDAVREIERQERVVIAVDQFEELFTAVESGRDRQAFVEALVEVAWDPERRASVIIAVRADFYGRLTEYPELAALSADGHALVGPMSRAELRRTIEGPAARAGLEVEQELTDELVDDVVGAAGALPLLSTTLRELWARRAGDTMRLAAYEQMGRVDGAVSRLAETTYERLPAQRQVDAQRLMVRLAGMSEDGAVVRRRVTLAELAGDDLTPVAHALAEHRLLSIDDGFVEVSHEALLREWPRLRDWLAEDAEGRRLSLRLERAASEWDEGNRDPAALIRGGGLVAAREWCGVPANARRLSPLAATFVDASDAAERSEIERRRRAARRLGGALVATVLLLLAVAVVGVVAFAQRGHARRAALAAEAGRLGAQALVEPTLDRSLLLAREAVNLDDTPATESDLLAALLRSPRALSVLRLSDKPLIADALSPDGRTLAAMTADGRVYFVDTATMRRVGSTYETAQGVQYAQGNLVTPVRSLAFSPNGRTLAVGSSDGSLGLFALLDVKTHAVLARRVVPGQIVADVVYRPGGGMLVTGEQVRCCTRREVVALRSLTGAVIRRSAPLPHGRVVGFFDGNRAILVTEGPSKAVLLNARTLAVERTLAFGEPAVIAADEEHVAFAEPDGTVETRDLRSPRAPRVLGRPSFPVALGFGADGKVLAVSSSDGTVSVWDTRSGTPLSTLTGHTAEAQVPLVDTAAGAVLAVGHDGQLIAWDISGRHGFEHSFVAPGGPGTVASSRALIATASKNHVMLRDGRTLRRVRTLAAAFGDPSGVALSANGRFAAAVGTRAGVVWNVASGRVVLSTQPYLHGVNTVAFSPDETWVAFGGLDARSGWRIYRLASRKMIRDVRGSGPSTANISFSRDGRLLAVTDLAGGVSIEQATGNEFVVAESVGVGVYAIAFSPDDSLFATGDQNGDVRLWSTRTGNEVGAPFNDHGGLVTGVVFDPKGSTLATSSGDGKLRIWNVATRKLVGSPLPGGGSGVAFYPDGSSLFGVSSRDGSGTVWPLDPAVWESISCKIAHRNLTRAEWAAVLPDRPYRAVCRAG